MLRLTVILLLAIILKAQNSTWVFSNQQSLSTTSSTAALNLINNSTESQHLLVGGLVTGTASAFQVEQNLVIFPPYENALNWIVTTGSSSWNTNIMALGANNFLFFGQVTQTISSSTYNLYYFNTGMQYVKNQAANKANCGTGDVTRLLSYSEGFTDMLLIGTNAGSLCLFNVAGNNMSIITTEKTNYDVRKIMITYTYVYAISAYTTLIVATFGDGLNYYYSPLLDEPFVYSTNNLGSFINDGLVYKTSTGTYFYYATSYGVSWLTSFTAVKVGNLFAPPAPNVVTAIILATDGNFNDLLIAGCTTGNIYAYNFNTSQYSLIYDAPYGASQISKLLFNWELNSQDGGTNRPIVIVSNTQGQIIILYLDGGSAEELGNPYSWYVPGQTVIDMMFMDYGLNIFSNGRIRTQNFLTVSLSKGELNYLNTSQIHIKSRSFLNPTPSQNQVKYTREIPYFEQSQAMSHKSEHLLYSLYLRGSNISPTLKTAITVSGRPSFFRIKNEIDNNHAVLATLDAYTNGTLDPTYPSYQVACVGYDISSNPNRTDHDIVIFVNLTGNTKSALQYEKFGNIPLNSVTFYSWDSTTFTRSEY